MQPLLFFISLTGPGLVSLSKGVGDVVDKVK
jgi:hypothetical protein